MVDSLAIFLPHFWLYCWNQLQNNRNQRFLYITFIFWHNYHHRFRQGTCCGNCLFPGSHFPFVHSHRVGTDLWLQAPGAAGEHRDADTPHTPSWNLWRCFWPFQPWLVSVCPVKLRAAQLDCRVNFLSLSLGTLRLCSAHHLCKKHGHVAGCPCNYPLKKVGK